MESYLETETKIVLISLVAGVGAFLIIYAGVFVFIRGSLVDGADMAGRILAPFFFLATGTLLHFIHIFRYAKRESKFFYFLLWIAFAIITLCGWAMLVLSNLAI